MLIWWSESNLLVSPWLSRSVILPKTNQSRQNLIISQLAPVNDSRVLCGWWWDWGDDIRFWFCQLFGPVNRPENWKSWERRGEKIDYHWVNRKKIWFSWEQVMSKKRKGNGSSDTQKDGTVQLSDTVRAEKKTSTPIASDRTTDKGGSDKNAETWNKNLAQGEQNDTVHTVTSYFDPVWNAFSQHTDGS